MQNYLYGVVVVYKIVTLLVVVIIIEKHLCCYLTHVTKLDDKWVWGEVGGVGKEHCNGNSYYTLACTLATR